MLPWVVISGLILAGLAPLVVRLAHNRGGYWLTLGPLALTAALASFWPAVAQGEALVWSRPWAPSFGVAFSFYVDGLTLLLALPVAAIGALICIYAQGYMGDDPALGQFYAVLLSFMAAMLGVLLAGNLLTLFIFWELTSITSYLLIGHQHTKAAARAAAWQALIVTGSGGLAMLAGLILVAALAGGGQGFEPEFSRLLAAGPLHGQPLYSAALVLIVIGAFTKSAQVPFQFWLPGAMAAPTPVSAYLHSATMVKAGVYLLARLAPVLGGSALWFGLVVGGGALTLLVGAWLSWQNDDLKRILAYSTVAVLGALTMLVGLAGDGSHWAAEAFGIVLIAHVLYKAALFLSAGAVDHATGTRDVTALAGLRRPMPWLFAAVLIAACSQAGLPFTPGFVGKELLYESTLHAPAGVAAALTALAVLANGMVGAAAGLVALRPFLGRTVRAPHALHLPGPALLIGPLLLGGLALLLGVWPGLFDVWGSRAGSALIRPAVTVHLHALPALNLPFALSVVTLALAALIYAVRDRLLDPLRPLRGAAWGSERWYDAGMRGLLRIARLSTDLLQNGNLRIYLGVIVAAAVALTAVALAPFPFVWPRPTSGAALHEWAVAVMIIVGAAAAVRTHSRLAAIAALGVVGLGMALFFILFEAPDLALTQLAIETLSVILIALVMGRLPRFTSEPARGRWAAAVIAVTAGVVMTAVVFTLLNAPDPSRLTAYFNEHSYEDAHGRNIVNVILVDFRGFDTLGEITVLAVAGIGVFALTRLRGSRRPSDGPTADRPTPARLPAMRSVVLGTAARFLLPLLLIFSVYLLVRGHNDPGGGFVGGLAAAAAFALYALAHGPDAARRALPATPLRFIAVGLLTALVSGLLPLLSGRAFMQGVWSAVALPAVGEPGTPLLFDIGVYCVVVGVVLTIVFTLLEDGEETAA